MPWKTLENSVLGVAVLMLLASRGFGASATEDEVTSAIPTEARSSTLSKPLYRQASPNEIFSRTESMYLRVRLNVPEIEMYGGPVVMYMKVIVLSKVGHGVGGQAQYLVVPAGLRSADSNELLVHENELFLYEDR